MKGRNENEAKKEARYCYGRRGGRILWKTNATELDKNSSSSSGSNSTKGIKIKHLLKIVKSVKVYTAEFTRETARAMFFLYQEDLDKVDTNSDEKLLAGVNVDFGQFLMIMCEEADRGIGGENELLAKKLHHLIHRLKKYEVGIHEHHHHHHNHNKK